MDLPYRFDFHQKFDVDNYLLHHALIFEKNKLLSEMISKIILGAPALIPAHFPCKIYIYIYNFQLNLMEIEKY